MMNHFNVTQEISKNTTENFSVTPASPMLTTPAMLERDFVTIGYILSVVSVLIISTNFLVAIALILLIRKKGCQSWCFVLNLSIADILVGVAITGIATDALEGSTTSMQKEKCLLRMSFILAPSAASILTMFVISLDRYVAIKMPLRYLQLMSNKIIATALILLWLMTVIVGFLPYIVTQMQRKDYNRICTFFLVIEPQSIIVMFCVFFFPVLCVFIYFYMDILKIACGHQQRISARQAGSSFMPSSRYWGHVKALRTIAVLVGCFTLCWCPFFVVSMVQVLCPDCKLYTFLENHLWLLGLSNSLINPLVYACWQREVRTQICMIFNHIKVGLCCPTRSQTADQCNTDHITITREGNFNGTTLPIELGYFETVAVPEQHPEKYSQ
nr:glucose-dependent insulinotropic receptor [Misgurnus anguillicaudatus]